jgi:Outer membrane protein beta-barrel domain
VGEQVVPRALVLCLAVYLSATATARSDPGRFEITPYGAYSFGGSFSDTETDASVRATDSPNFGLIFNFRESAYTQWEILYSRQNTEVEAAGLPTISEPLEMDLHYLQAGGTYQGEGNSVRPYLAATVGAAFFDVRTDGFNSDTFFSFSIGPGLQIRPNDRLGIRLEARVFGTLVRSDSRLFCVSNPGGGTAGCAITITGEVFWQMQAMAGVVFRF